MYDEIAPARRAVHRSDGICSSGRARINTCAAGTETETRCPVQLRRQEETEDGYRDHFCRRLLERLLILFDENNIQLEETDMNYFMQKIGKNENDTFDVAV